MMDKNRQVEKHFKWESEHVNPIIEELMDIAWNFGLKPWTRFKEMVSGKIGNMIGMALIASYDEGYEDALADIERGKAE